MKFFKVTSPCSFLTNLRFSLPLSNQNSLNQPHLPTEHTCSPFVFLFPFLMVPQESRRKESAQEKVCKAVRRQYSWKWKATAFIHQVSKNWPNLKFWWGILVWRAKELPFSCSRSLHAGTRALSWCKCKSLSPGPWVKLVRIWSAAGNFNQKHTSSFHRAARPYWYSHPFLLDVFRYLQNLKTFGPNAVKTCSYGYSPGIFPPFLLAQEARDK